jgi:hypothetical protein
MHEGVRILPPSFILLHRHAHPYPQPCCRARAGARPPRRPHTARPRLEVEQLKTQLAAKERESTLSANSTSKHDDDPVTLKVAVPSSSSRRPPTRPPSPVSAPPPTSQVPASDRWCVRLRFLDIFGTFSSLWRRLRNYVVNDMSAGSMSGEGICVHRVAAVHGDTSHFSLRPPQMQLFVKYVCKPSTTNV